MDELTQTKVEQATDLTLAKLQSYRKITGAATTPEQIRMEAAASVQMLGLQAEFANQIISEIEKAEDVSLDSTFITSFESGENNALWEAPSEMPLTDRYLELLRIEGWNPQSRLKLLRSTKQILTRCGNPGVEAPWTRHGMVVGEVQSGKTTSYTALICAAIDAGYKNIIVLGGRTNDLRHQTQERIDLGVRGAETMNFGEGAKPIGVGLLGQIPNLVMVSLTTQDHLGAKGGGDFNGALAMRNNVTGPAIRIGVIKKHARIINLIGGWLETNGNINDEPLLVIDDEADDASIDTNDADQTPTAINRAIRELLQRAQRATYVAYTATPYANIMIHPDAWQEGYGQDLFPKDFIALLEAPEHYFGARRFLRDQNEHPRTVRVKDAEQWIGGKGKKNSLSTIPESLVEAITEFLLVSAARRVRSRRAGKTRGHESMLIHANVLTQIHHMIAEQVELEITTMAAHWTYPVIKEGDEISELEQRFKNFWKKFEHRQDDDKHVSWEELRPHISDVFESLNVVVINGQTQAKLDYRRTQAGPLTVIAVGGTKLSRGLTLEGLTTSYHLRTSKQHDTLMQMGRWFGYRTGYEDLCRLHSTPELITSFAETMESDNELRADLREMISLGATPLEFGLRVKNSPGMLVTARNKLRNGYTIRASLSGQTLEITRTNLEDAEHNDEVLQQLVKQLTQPRDDKWGVWDNVPWHMIEAHLNRFKEKSLNEYNQISRAKSYIEGALKKDPERLALWTVTVRSLTTGELEPYGGHVVSRVTRKRRAEEEDTLSFGAISDPADEGLAIGANRSGSKRTEFKQGRDRNHGLLMIYPIIAEGDKRTSSIAISFPFDRELDSNDYTYNVIAQSERRNS